MPPRSRTKNSPDLADTTKKIVDLLVEHPDTDRRKILDAVRSLIATAPTQPSTIEEIFRNPPRPCGAMSYT